MIQFGDPQTRDMTKQASWGTGKQRHAGRRRRDHEEAAAWPGRRRHGAQRLGQGASSQFYITLRAAPTLDGKFAVFGKVIKGLDVAAKIQKADVLKKASVKE